jgi:hypothetical protein
MNKIIISTAITIAFMSAILISAIAEQSFPKTPWMFYAQKQAFFYTLICRKYKCLDNGVKKFPGTEIENLGIGDARYSNYFKISAVRSQLGTSSMWPNGVNLWINSEIRYSALTTNLSRKFVDSDTYELVSNLIYELIGKKYLKEQIIRCLQTNKKSTDIYYLDESLKFPSNAPITKVSSGQGVPFYLKVYCDRTNESTLSVELSP